jgi:hypothetical protein
MSAEIRIDDGGWASVASLGVGRMVRRRLSRAAGTLTLYLPGGWRAASPVARDQRVRVRLASDGDVWFSGRVTDVSRDAEGAREGLTVVVSDAWWDLEHCPVLRDQASLGQWGSADGTVASGRVVLGVGDDGVREDLGAEVARLVAYAATRGAMVQMGDVPSAPVMPAGAARDRTVAQVVLDRLSVLPDATTVVDYSTDPPTLHVRRRGEMTGTLIEPSEEEVSSVRARERSDLLVAGVIVNWELTGLDSDGVPSVRVVQDTAGTVSGLRTLVVTLEQDDRGAVVAGEDPPPPFRAPTVTYHRQSIQTRPLPANGATDEAAKRWWVDHIPFLAGSPVALDLGQLLIAGAALDVPEQALTVRPHTVVINQPDVALPPAWQDPAGAARPADPADPADYPRELVRGQLQDWMRGKRVAAADVTATLAYRASTIEAIANEGVREAFRQFFSQEAMLGGTLYRIYQAGVTVQATNLTTGVEVGVASYDAGGVEDAEPDPVPEEGSAPRFPPPPTVGEGGLAEALYAALGTPQWEGSVRLLGGGWHEAELMGRTLGLTVPGRAELATMAALVVDVVDDLGDGSTTVRWGPHPHVAPETMARLQRLGRDVQPEQRRDRVSWPQTVAPQEVTYQSDADQEPEAPVLGGFSPVATGQAPAGGLGGGRRPGLMVEPAAGGVWIYRGRFWGRGSTLRLVQGSFPEWSLERPTPQWPVVLVPEVDGEPLDVPRRYLAGSGDLYFRWETTPGGEPTDAWFEFRESAPMGQDNNVEDDVSGDYWVLWGTLTAGGEWVPSAEAGDVYWYGLTVQTLPELY